MKGRRAFKITALALGRQKSRSYGSVPLDFHRCDFQICKYCQPRDKISIIHRQNYQHVIKANQSESKFKRSNVSTTNPNREHPPFNSLHPATWYDFNINHGIIRCSCLSVCLSLCFSKWNADSEKKPNDTTRKIERDTWRTQRINRSLPPKYFFFFYVLHTQFFSFLFPVNKITICDWDRCSSNSSSSSHHQQQRVVILFHSSCWLASRSEINVQYESLFEFIFIRINIIFLFPSFSLESVALRPKPVWLLLFSGFFFQSRVLTSQRKG